MHIYRAIPLSTLLTAALCVGNPVAAAQAEEKPVPEAEVAKVAKKNPNKRVCRKVKPTGSHIPTRVCLKQRDWDEMQRAAQQTLRNSTSNSVGS